VIALQQPRLYASYYSPDGIWRVDIIIYDCVKTSMSDMNAYEKLILMNADTGEEQLADDQLQYCGGVGTVGLDGRFWSPNSRYFYYTDAREGYPDGNGSYWVPPLIQLDVTNLNKIYLGYGPRSPDGTKIATWQSNSNELVVWDINGGVIIRLPALTPNVPLGPMLSTDRKILSRACESI
jgi:hypothetical protein